MPCLARWYVHKGTTKSSLVAQVLTYAQVSALRQSGAFVWHQDYSWSHVVGAGYENARPHSMRPSAIPALQNAAISKAESVEDGTIMPLAGGPQLLKHLPFVPELSLSKKRQRSDSLIEGRDGLTKLRRTHARSWCSIM